MLESVAPGGAVTDCHTGSARPAATGRTDSTARMPHRPVRCQLAASLSITRHDCCRRLCSLLGSSD